MVIGDVMCVVKSGELGDVFDVHEISLIFTCVILFALLKIWK